MLYNFDDLSFQILTIDRFSHKKGIFDVKGRPYASLSIRINGTGRFEIGGKSFLSEVGDLLFIPVNMPYRVEYSGGESIVVHFSSCNYFEAESISLENPTAITVQLQHLLQTWQSRHSINQAKSILYDVLEKIATEKRLLLHDTAIVSCIRYLDAHFADPELDIASVCAVCFISVSALQRAFAEHLGTSPRQYLIQLRMNRALELLARDELSIKEIAFACGFSDEKYFSRAFKKKYKRSPSHLRRHVSV